PASAVYKAKNAELMSSQVLLTFLPLLEVRKCLESFPFFLNLDLSRFKGNLKRKIATVCSDFSLYEPSFNVKAL
ncbi:hypothetical protein ACXWO4_09280, partial [Streptococcus pyogenes]